MLVTSDSKKKCPAVGLCGEFDLWIDELSRRSPELEKVHERVLSDRNINHRHTWNIGSISLDPIPPGICVII